MTRKSQIRKLLTASITTAKTAMNCTSNSNHAALRQIMAEPNHDS